jgi:hypothetical protein
VRAVPATSLRIVVAWLSFLVADCGFFCLKITKGVSNQLKNQAINKTEGFVNNKANTFLNAFGAGRSEVSIGLFFKVITW